MILSSTWDQALMRVQCLQELWNGRARSQGAAEPNQIFTCSIDGVGQSFSEKNECCFLRQIN